MAMKIPLMDMVLSVIGTYDLWSAVASKLRAKYALKFALSTTFKLVFFSVYYITSVG